jgi:diketogulonate reductase-like aldo/keto reductase
VLAQIGKAGDAAFLATKVWMRGRREGIAQMKQSLAHFGRDHIALMQIHNLVDWRTQLATLRAWGSEGHIRYIGVAHYASGAFAELEAIMRAEPLDLYRSTTRRTTARLKRASSLWWHGAAWPSS